MRILLVEDDRSIAGFVGPELEHLGFRVRCAYDGTSGLEEVERFRPKLIILDIMLPRLDGIGVLKRLREAGNMVPIIMLTARDSEQCFKAASKVSEAAELAPAPPGAPRRLRALRTLYRNWFGELDAEPFGATADKP